MDARRCATWLLSVEKPRNSGARPHSAVRKAFSSISTSGKLTLPRSRAIMRRARSSSSEKKAMRRALLPDAARNPAATKFSKASIVPGASVSLRRAATSSTDSAACRASWSITRHHRASAGPLPKARTATGKACNADVAARAPA
jgi:hypothetical protein